MPEEPAPEEFTPAEPVAGVTVVVLAYGTEPLLHECLLAVLDSRRVAVELVVVDNGCSREDLPDLRRLVADAGGTWLEPGRNTGFAEGCNLGIAAGAAPFVALVNSDAVVEPDALSRLVTLLDADPTVGIATGLVVLADTPEVVNAAGNPVHWSGLSWAGGYGDPVRDHLERGEAASASGALLATTRAWWEWLGGLSEQHFAYLEDAELSLRTWLAGRRVVVEPAAVAHHAYEFSRNDRKWFLLERNRWLNLLTLYERRTLWSLAPGLLVVEVGVTAAALRGGWFAAKRESWAWLWRYRDAIGARRRQVFRGRRVHDGPLLAVLADRVTPGEGSGVSVPPVVNDAFVLQGAAARRLANARRS